MESLFKGAFLAATTALVFVACNKDQSAINKLDGSWEVTDGTFWIDGVEQPADTSAASAGVTTMNFTKFKLKDADMGSGSQVFTPTTGSATTTNFDYKILEDGTKFWWSTVDTSSTDDITANISELTGKSFTYDFSIDFLGATWKWEVVAAKQ